MKMLIKTTCLQKDYDVSMSPNDSGVMNEVGLQLFNLTSTNQNELLT